MDALQKLRYEFPGIKTVICNYTDSGNVMNFLNGLESGILEGNKDKLMYFLREICEWYNNEISEIHYNEFVYNDDEHNRNRSLLNSVFEELKEYDFDSMNLKGNENKKMVGDEPLIFLSHRSTDKKYGDALEKLFTGMGIKNEQLIYSSHPLHKIPLDKNIYEYLRSALGRKVFMIILWSNEYLESPACLNEMGAAWVTHTDYTNIYVPSFDFSNPKYYQCAVDKNKMGAVLDGSDNCKTSIIELKNKLVEMFSLHVDEKSWTYLLDNFVKELKELRDE